MKICSLAAAALALAIAVGACSSSTTTVVRTTAPTAASDHEQEPTRVKATGQRCGVERWPVKTGTDADANKVDLNTVMPTTIASLAQTTAPDEATLQQSARTPPIEMTVYRIQGILTAFKEEADQDFHLVITNSDGQGNVQTMIVEIPDPACVGTGSPFLPGITAARAAFLQRFTPSNTSFTHVSVPVTVTGVGFFDPEHGQSGGLVLSGGKVTIELHPVTDISFGS